MFWEFVNSKIWYNSEYSASDLKDFIRDQYVENGKIFHNRLLFTARSDKGLVDDH